jgi:hypothetical protein
MAIITMILLRVTTTCDARTDCALCTMAPPLARVTWHVSSHTTTNAGVQLTAGVLNHSVLTRASFSTIASTLRTTSRLGSR